MIKIFTENSFTIEDKVNNWLKENDDNIEVLKITQSSCGANGSGVHVTVMIEYVDLMIF